MANSTVLYTFVSAILPFFEKRPISGVHFRPCGAGNFCPPFNQLFPGCLLQDRTAPPNAYSSSNTDFGHYRQATFKLSDDFCVKESKPCRSYLIDGEVPDITAVVNMSSKYGNHPSVTGYKLFSNEVTSGTIVPCWTPHTSDPSPYIQVVFANQRNVSGVVIAERGRVDYNAVIYYQWVTEYSLQFTDDGSSWYDYKDNVGQTILIEGNDGSYIPKVHYFPSILQLQGVRIRPTKKYNYFSLRFDIIGC